MTEWQESHESMSVLASATGVTFPSPLILSPVLRAPMRDASTQADGQAVREKCFRREIVQQFVGRSQPEMSRSRNVFGAGAFNSPRKTTMDLIESMEASTIRVDTDTRNGSVLNLITMVLGCDSSSANTTFRRLLQDNPKLRGTSRPVSDPPTSPIQILDVFGGKIGKRSIIHMARVERRMSNDLAGKLKKLRSD